MKKLAILLAVSLLNGCALWNAYMMSGFDPNEYMLITQIRVDSQTYKTQCSNAILAETNAASIAAKTNLFEKYSEKIPYNENSYNASKSLNEIAQGLAKAYEKGNVSSLFCKLKYGSIENSATVMQSIIGNKPR